MRGDQLARQWRILRAIEPRKQGANVSELAAQEGYYPRTIWRDLSAIEPARLTSLLQSDQVRYSPRQLEAQAKTGKPQLARDAMTMEVGGLVEVMSWVMGLEAFGRLSVLQQIKKDEGFTHPGGICLAFHPSTISLPTGQAGQAGIL